MSQHSFQGALAHPPPRLLPFASSSPNDDDDDYSLTLPSPAPTRGPQRSRTAADLPLLFNRTQSSSPTGSSTFLPFLRPQSTTSQSISPGSVAASHINVKVEPGEPTTTVKRKLATTSTTVDRLASWFEGSSEPVNITLIPSPSPRKEKLNPVDEMGPMSTPMHDDFADTFTTRRNNNPKRPSMSDPSTSTSRFSFFRRSAVVSQPSQQDIASANDELAQLNIQEALFPHGHPDEFSPAVFKNLQLNAEGTLRRFQQAYIEQLKALKSAISTKNVQADELEAAQTRNEHLKLQLQDMAERAAEQERQIAELNAQLLQQQRSSLETHQSQQRSIRIVGQECAQPDDAHAQVSKRRNRSSDVSTLGGGSEAGSDVSSVVSVFSEALSVAPSSAATSVVSAANNGGAYARDNCPRCHGLSESEAWDVIGMMKMESTVLKQRIAQLESAQDDALDFLSGLKLS
ncbi:hypothetical protein HRR83_002231 [Exophiala dermatitidis]|uniref:Uncharacterized protein n=2 Tax=Exophiala dermatitidis TaxID=5970 RepID=H6BYB2_EXODN|nr:uncharacterized protein HMPREF1120_04755 [Exophiala dermatitidis NIH/UT8656]KAJ4524113.1 hypothetical protein HRR74_002308 [Exophiala dermatitidis]EHY56680.1 hypothetical protein HMPREF1120_04755 [Exophiala dermatitidis NIH/UT8656]KAJ4525615.1 hypothetical protein HRR73_002347 [Exophiala dermatitidis]KAJ4536932.1 hypothetical protein HRR76_004959 [Exophiala dermatitidis]KAJ4555467.1 hypothetical protein HRR77_001396 [Exophiala dermatitidis]